MSTIKSFPSPVELKGAVQGTLLYIGLFFVFIQYQSYSKFYLLAQKKKQRDPNSKEKVQLSKIKYYNNEDPLALRGDRTVGNYLEFSVTFLSLLWIHAIFVDATKSFTIAVLYTFCRSYYPLVFSFTSPTVLASTAPGYLIIFYMMYEIITKFLMV